MGRIAALVVGVLVVSTGGVARAQEAPQAGGKKAEGGQAAGTATAAAADEVKTLFKDGVDRYDKGEFKTALEKFEAAYGKKPLPIILYNIAWCRSKLGKNVDAVKAFEAFLEDTKGVSEKQVGAAKAELARLGGLVGKLSIKEAEKGLKVDLDGVIVGQTPLDGPLVLEPGHHVVTVEKSGTKPFVKKVSIEAGKEIDLTFVFEPLPPGYVPPPKKVEPPPADMGTLKLKSNVAKGEIVIDGAPQPFTKGSLSIPLEKGKHKVKVAAAAMIPWEGSVDVKKGKDLKLDVKLVKDKKKIEAAFYSTLGLALAAFAAMAGTGGYSLALRGDYDDARDAYEADRTAQKYEAMKDARDEAAAYQAATDALLGVGCALAAAAVVTGALNPFVKKSEAKLSLAGGTVAAW